MARIIKRGSKAIKSDSVTVRLDPKLRYLADIAARSQRRSLSAFVEWAVELALNEVNVKTAEGVYIPAYDLGDFVWDIDEADRFVKLAIHAPELLSYEEQKVWKLIKQYPFSFLENPYKHPPSHPFKFDDDTNMDYVAIRENWDIIQSACFYDEDSDDAMKSLMALEIESKTSKVDDIPF